MFGFICKKRSTAVNVFSIAEELPSEPPAANRILIAIQTPMLSKLFIIYTCKGIIAMPYAKSTKQVQNISRFDVFLTASFVAANAMIEIKFNSTVITEIAESAIELNRR